MPESTEFSWAQQQRFRFIEWQLLWGLQLNAKMIMDTFGVSRYQAGLDIKAYNQQCPGNIRPYNPADRCYKPALSFKPLFASQNPTEFIESVSGQIPGHSPLSVVPILQRVIADGVLPAVMTAIEGNYRIQTIYASATTPIGSKRVLCPVALVYVANRLHIRAFCELRQEYRDFVLSRFLMTPKILVDERVEELPEDKDWKENVDITLVPNPKLDKDGQALIAREYALEEHTKVTLQKALIHYYLQANLLPHSKEQVSISKNNPWAFPLVVENWDEIAQLLFT